MEDRFAGIREFVAAVDGASLTAAADTLGVTGSAVGLDLTTEGEAYLASCRRILDELDEAEALLTTGRRQPIGRLRVDLPTTFGRRHIVPVLLRLAQRHARLDLSITLRDRAVDMVSEGIDLAVRIGMLEDYPDLIARRLGEQRLVICAAPAYLQRRGTPAALADILKHDCLVGWQRGNRPEWLLGNDAGEAAYFEIPARHELTDGDALLCACLTGCGLAQLPGWLARESLADGSLIEVLPELATTMPIHAIWQKTRHFQPKVKIAVEALASLAKKQAAVFNP